MKKALFVIDYTNDFVADNGKLTCGKVAQDIEDNIVGKIIEYYSNGDMIYVINDIHYEGDLDHPESKLFPKHNIIGTDGRLVYGKVGEILKKVNAIFLNKTLYSAFSNPRIKWWVLDDAEGIELCGVCTDICILHTAVDAYNLGLNVIVDSNCVASFNQAGHEWALNHFKNVLGFNVI